MKIGIFDSGLGGLIITHSLIQALPEYDLCYLGDTARVPYGNRSEDIIYQFAKEATDYLFAQGCGLIIMACNTVSAEALRRLQQEYLPARYPGKKVLGVIVPAAEVATKSGARVIGVIGTEGTVRSKTFEREIHKLEPTTRVVSLATPLLVPLIESGSEVEAAAALQKYLPPLIERGIDTLVLGCTHYPVLKKQIRQICGTNINVISQDELMPDKFARYLKRRPEIDEKLSKTGQHIFAVTDLTPAGEALAARLFKGQVKLIKVSLG